jgi:hypothetical protein
MLKKRNVGTLRAGQSETLQSYPQQLDRDKSFVINTAVLKMRSSHEPSFGSKGFALQAVLALCISISCPPISADGFIRRDPEGEGRPGTATQKVRTLHTKGKTE